MAFIIRYLFVATDKPIPTPELDPELPPTTIWEDEGA